MKFAILAALSAPALVFAQIYGPAPGSGGSSSASSATSSAAATPSAAPGQHIVLVSPDGQFDFQPNNVTAPAGDNVTFVFPTTGGLIHSVTQTSFANPCALLDGGFDSQLQPNGMTFTITITNASQPIWFYCKQTDPFKHCGMGMVGGINIPNGTANSVDAFVSAAKALGNNEASQTASGGLTGVGAAATGPAASATASAPASSGSSSSSSAERLLVGTGSMLAALFALFALA